MVDTWVSFYFIFVIQHVSPVAHSGTYSPYIIIHCQLLLRTHPFLAYFTNLLTVMYASCYTLIGYHKWMLRRLINQTQVRDYCILIECPLWCGPSQRTGFVCPMLVLFEWVMQSRNCNLH